jgi:hypothetical protein
LACIQHEEGSAAWACTEPVNVEAREGRGGELRLVGFGEVLARAAEDLALQGLWKRKCAQFKTRVVGY